jgi:hypothetical protein
MLHHFLMWLETEEARHTTPEEAAKKPHKYIAPRIQSGAETIQKTTPSIIAVKMEKMDAK